MKSFVYLLLISAFLNSSYKVNAAYPLEEDDVERMIQKRKKSFFGSDNDRLTLTPLSNGGFLAKTQNSIVWKGHYNDLNEVAIKIMWNEESMAQEMKILQVLNSTEDQNIEAKGIPKIYYMGKFRKVYIAIAMSLFEESVEDRFKKQNYSISYKSVLLIFREAVKSLEYIHSKGIVHNDIKPANIFLRGENVFIGDFDLATINCSVWTEGHTPRFASMNFYENKPRLPKDDIESLIYSMWYIAGVPVGRPYFRETALGDAFSKCRNNRRAADLLRDKCDRIRDEKVAKAFQNIFFDEILSNKTEPNYQNIIDTLNKTLKKITSEWKAARFEWLPEASSSGSSKPKLSKKIKNFFKI